jgi:hypothetical protein
VIELQIVVCIAFGTPPAIPLPKPLPDFLASSLFIPPYWDRQQVSVASLTSKDCSTAAMSLPALSIASASRSFATISSGRCFFRRLSVIESLLPQGVVDLHTDWIRISKAGQGQFSGWLEGNAVISRDGRLQNLLRVESPSGNRAALVSCNRTGRKPTFDPAIDFVELPGGAKKFTVRYDAVSEQYWSLTNPTPGSVPRFAQSIRNTLALVSSPDLRKWTIRFVVLHHPDRSRHGYQYPDFLIEEADLIAAVRTAHDDEHSGAESAHHSNFITFHRFPQFRGLDLADSVIDPAVVGPQAYQRESP